MISFPNCKINLGLNVVGKRTDGYHNLETVFYPINLKDALEAIQAIEFKCSMTGLSVQGDIDNNLCVQAYKLLKKDYPQLPAISIHLHKVIPMGAGLGGGSADGAFMLSLLNKKFHLNITDDKLLEYALMLGSDCPFFIINKPCFATGRGEILKPVNVDLSAYKIVLINPGIHVSTKDAFAELTPTSPTKSLLEITQQPVETWKGQLINDFEKTVFKKYPEISGLKSLLYDKGATYASMTGTGSTIFGLFKQDVFLTFQLPETYLLMII